MAYNKKHNQKRAQRVEKARIYQLKKAGELNAAKRAERRLESMQKDFGDLH